MKGASIIFPLLGIYGTTLMTEAQVSVHRAYSHIEIQELTYIPLYVLAVQLFSSGAY